MSSFNSVFASIKKMNDEVIDSPTFIIGGVYTFLGRTYYDLKGAILHPDGLRLNGQFGFIIDQPLIKKINTAYQSALEEFQKSTSPLDTHQFTLIAAGKELERKGRKVTIVGALFFSDGRTFEGNFSLNFEKIESYRSSDSTVEAGEFETTNNGMEIHHGKVTFDDGIILEGTMTSGLYESGSIGINKAETIEVLEYKSKHVIIKKLSDEPARFVAGKLNGSCEVLITHPRYPTHTTVWKGVFVNGKLNGTGEMHLDDNVEGKKSLRLDKKGYFKDSQLHGEGELIESNYSEKGQYENGELKKGVVHFDGHLYEGEFENSELKKGKHRFPNGTVKEGVFERLEYADYHYLKEGKVSYPDGSAIEGQFNFLSPIFPSAKIMYKQDIKLSAFIFNFGIVESLTDEPFEFKNGLLNGACSINFQPMQNKDGTLVEEHPWILKALFKDGLVVERIVEYKE